MGFGTLDFGNWLGQEPECITPGSAAVLVLCFRMADTNKLGPSHGSQLRRQPLCFNTLRCCPYSVCLYRHDQTQTLLFELAPRCFCEFAVEVTVEAQRSVTVDRQRLTMALLS
jgi:hypothetical protein